MSIRVELLDVSGLGYEERLLAASLQGLVNRAADRRAGQGRPRGAAARRAAAAEAAEAVAGGPAARGPGGAPGASGALLFLDYGSNDDPGTRRTNSVMMTEEDWEGRYRPFLSRNDLDNLDYYRGALGLEVEKLPGLEAAVARHRSLLKGIVVLDPYLEDSVNLALCYAGLESLLVVHPRLVRWAAFLGLPVVEDLRDRFKDRVSLYSWAFRELRPRCASWAVASSEPAWRRPEFADYIVKEGLFVVGLSSFGKGGLRSFGQKLLLFLLAGPWALRQAVFTLRLDGALRRLALLLVRHRAPETSLLCRILRSVRPEPYPTLFGWHVDRDDELSFMTFVSASGLRLAPSFMAANFSFHSGLPATVPLVQPEVDPGTVTLERDRVYVSFTLSDGDQLALMNTAEVGGWRRPERGRVPFNWEIQPLLADYAPALLGYYYSTLTPADLLVAGPSGAGYVMPPLVPRLGAYFRASAEACARCGIRIATSYNGDPPRRVLAAHARAEGFLGFVAGYFHLGRRPARIIGGKTFVANSWPPVDAIGASKDETLEGIRALVQADGPLPRFVGCHLFAYRTNVADVASFVATLDPARVKVVRADEFLAAARLWMEEERSRGPLQRARAVGAARRPT